MSISVEAFKMSFLRNMITSQSRCATTTESLGLAIGGKNSSPGPLHFPKISTRNILNWIRNELFSSCVHLAIFDNWIVVILH